VIIYKIRRVHFFFDEVFERITEGSQLPPLKYYQLETFLSLPLIVRRVSMPTINSRE